MLGSLIILRIAYFEAASQNLMMITTIINQSRLASELFCFGALVGKNYRSKWYEVRNCNPFEFSWLFLACHHSITDFEINAFLNQDSYRLLKFVSDLVSIFDTG
jgi:hypothetical protein